MHVGSVHAEEALEQAGKSPPCRAWVQVLGSWPTEYGPETRGFKYGFIEIKFTSCAVHLL